jgi:hypothetical protein
MGFWVKTANNTQDGFFFKNKAMGFLKIITVFK